LTGTEDQAHWQVGLPRARRVCLFVAGETRGSRDLWARRGGIEELPELRHADLDNRTTWSALVTGGSLSHGNARFKPHHE
jgi:hypothetical protein